MRAERIQLEQRLNTLLLTLAHSFAQFTDRLLFLLGLLLIELQQRLRSPAPVPDMQRLLQHLTSAAWAQRLLTLPGYAPDHCGEVASMKRLLPWWT